MPLSYSFHFGSSFPSKFSIESQKACKEARGQRSLVTKQLRKTNVSICIIFQEKFCKASLLTHLLPIYILVRRLSQYYHYLVNRPSKSEYFAQAEFHLIIFWAELGAKIVVQKIWKNFGKWCQKYEKVPVFQVPRSKVKVLRRL